MKEIFYDALIDTGEMLPILFVIYYAIEYLENRYGSELNKRVSGTGAAGPAIGAILGGIPQCGFSVISTTFYISRRITLGTLLAVYLSTSDEAIPVILAQPQKSYLVMPLLITKIVIAILAGYVVDYVLTKNDRNTNARNTEEVKVCCSAAECCHGHHGKVKNKEMVADSIRHALQVFVFIFAVSLALNYIIALIGEDNMKKVLLQNSVFQPFITGLIGLIPNCAASVVITEVFLMGGISYGSAITGLSSGAGLGLLVLFKENGNLKETLKITGLLYGISVIVGVIIQFIYG